jgi:hypothetical protein
LKELSHLKCLHRPVQLFITHLEPGMESQILSEIAAT